MSDILHNAQFGSILIVYLPDTGKTTVFHSKYVLPYGFLLLRIGLWPARTSYMKMQNPSAIKTKQVVNLSIYNLFA